MDVIDMAEKKFLIQGRVIDPQTRHDIANLRVEAWDKDLRLNDLVGSAVTVEQGSFQMRFNETYFRELFLGGCPFYSRTAS